MNSTVLKQLVPLLFAVFVSMLGVGIISPILPVYAEMMGAGGFAIGIIFGLFSLSRAIVMPVYGRISDLKGRKIFIILGLSAYCVLSFAYVAAETVASLAVVRLFHGLASAATIPIVMAYVGDMSPPGEEGRLMGLYTTVLLMGFGSGPIIGGIVKDTLGINAAFYIMGGLVFVGLLMVIFMVTEPKEKGKVSEKYPFREMFDNRRIRALFAFRLANAVGRSAIFAFLPIFGHNLLSLSGTSIGFLLSAVVIVASIFQVPSGILADRVSKVNLVVAGGILNAVGLMAVGFCKSFAAIVVVVVLLGLSGAIALPALTAIAVNEGREIGMGSVMGIFNFAMSIGQSFGPFAAGYMMSMSGIRAPFYFAGTVAILGTGYFLSGMVSANKEVIRNGR
jgi:DHA1 family multidrug resistance protein-like MFS transporter